MYIVGTFVGGTLVAFSVEPTDDVILAQAKANGVDAKKIENVPVADRKKAKEDAIAKARSEMSVAVRSVLFWFFPLLLFPICGAAVGFISQGWTVFEAAFGSLVGQVAGFVAGRFMFGMEISWVELVIGLVVGFVIAGVGAYVGEAVQEKRERAALEDEVEDFE